MIAPKCHGCSRVVHEWGNDYCSVYAYPGNKWRLGPCPMATHVTTMMDRQERRRIGQQKQRKVVSK